MKTRWWKRTKAAEYKENGCQTLNLDQGDMEVELWQTGQHEHCPRRGASRWLRPSGLRQWGPRVTAEWKFCWVSQRETWNSKFWTWNLNFHMLAATLGRPNTTDVRIILSPWATDYIKQNHIHIEPSPIHQVKCGLYFSFSVGNIHVQNSCRMVCILLITFLTFKKILSGAR